MDLIVLGYGIFLVLGAFFGWKAGSKVSLIMGLVSGALVIFAGNVILHTPKQGFCFLIVISVVLSSVFLIRLVKTKKFMPAGMLSVVSVLFLVYCFTQYFNL